MYYHVSIERKNGNTLYEYNYVDKEDVINKILIPNLQEEKIFFAGSNLTSEEILKITIKISSDTIHNITYAHNQMLENISNEDCVYGEFFFEDIFNSESKLNNITRNIFDDIFLIVGKGHMGKLNIAVRDRFSFTVHRRGSEQGTHTTCDHIQIQQ